MDLKDKIVLAHRGYFNKECVKNYRENSKEVCEISTNKDYIGIIEVDVRKSKDGILYCYHGTLFQYWILLKFFRNFPAVKSRFKVNSLEEILNVITDDKIIVLDIKSISITKADILTALKGKKFKEIILGNTSMSSVSFLNNFDDMPSGFVKVMNGNIFCNFYDLEKLKRMNYKYFEVVFPFQISRKLIENVSKHSMEFRVAGLFFRNKQSYWNTINKYNIKHVSSDFI